MTGRADGGLVTIAEAGRHFGLRHVEALALVRSDHLRVVPSDQRRLPAGEPCIRLADVERALRCRYTGRSVDAMKARASLSPRERREIDLREQRQAIAQARAGHEQLAERAYVRAKQRALEIEMNHHAWQPKRGRKRTPEGDQGQPMTLSEIRKDARRVTEAARRRLAISEAKAGLTLVQRSRASKSTRQRSTGVSGELAVAQERLAKAQLDKLEARVRALYRQIPSMRARLRRGPVVTTVTAGGCSRRVEIKP